MSDIREIVGRIAKARGIRLLNPEPEDSPLLFRFTRQSGPFAWVDLDEEILSINRSSTGQSVALFDLIDRKVTTAQRSLFRLTIEHIANHNHNPLDRLRQIEQAAKALLDQLGPSFTSKAAFELGQLLNSKPGAASWSRDGYGKDPTP